MMNSQPIMSYDTTILKEKIRLKKLDRELYVDEKEEILRDHEEERKALRIGNVCLTHMTKKQNNMPVELNAAIFEGHPPNERLCMQTLPLQQSIAVNDSKLFKLGKRLLKQDYIREQKECKLIKSKRDLEVAKMEARSCKADYDKQCKNYLHTQVMVEDSYNREISAKLTHQRLQKILDELNKDIESYNVIIQNQEKKILDKTKELKDFQELKDRAKRYLALELEQLKPVNKELAKVTDHFEKLISVTRNEVDDRRKKGALAKFLAEREAHSLSFNETSSLLDIKFKNRNKFLVNAYDTILALKDAMMVSNIEHVVDCFLDQRDVTGYLNQELEEKEHQNAQLKEQLEGLKKNNEFLKFDANKATRFQSHFQEIVAEEAEESKKYNREDYLLRRQDKHISSMNVATHALMEKLRPIKLEDPFNLVQGDLIKDIESVIKKLEKMQSIVSSNTIPIGRVRPIMLQLFKEKRLPLDSIRVEMSHPLHASSITAFESFEADQPGLVTREMLKARAVESVASKKKGKGKKSKK